ncbi:hypothetical protein VST7929_01746 [Vibrio stylophorae]|uniref:Transcriptional regulator HTH-type FeoC domain-containing protein n=1 Tax=Vibrio stylophorae TaxID=659351 RepID=A0ABM8ZU96_9VIBR|nr:FeoC-like transcriptional regulator [Vibrio stylophorae]CAH0533870.1 hypothetical protein VST7929_01746 [Vibrio stylophorae]
MIMQSLFGYLNANGRTSRAKLAQHFALSEDGVDVMLERYMARGKVSKELYQRRCDKVPLVYYKPVAENELSIVCMH